MIPLYTAPAWLQDPVWWTAAGTIVLAAATIILTAASIVAGVMAVKAFRKQSSLLAMEQARDAKREDEAERADASRIAAWVVYKGPDDFDWVARLRNPTNLPIYDVKIAWKCGSYLVGPYASEQDIGIVEPRESPIELAMGDSFASHVDALQKATWNAEGGPSRHLVTIRLSFRDAAGAAWIREWDGKLVAASGAVSLDQVERLPKAISGKSAGHLLSVQNERARRAAGIPRPQ